MKVFLYLGGVKDPLELVPEADAAIPMPAAEVLALNANADAAAPTMPDPRDWRRLDVAPIPVVLSLLPLFEEVGFIGTVPAGGTFIPPWAI